MNNLVTRRNLIRSLAAGSILLPGIVQQVLAAESRGEINPVSPKSPPDS